MEKIFKIQFDKNDYMEASFIEKSISELYQQHGYDPTESRIHVTELTSLRLDGDKEFEKLKKALRITFDAGAIKGIFKEPFQTENFNEWLEDCLKNDTDLKDYIMAALSLSSDERGETDNFNSEEEILP